MNHRDHQAGRLLAARDRAVEDADSAREATVQPAWDKRTADMDQLREEFQRRAGVIDRQFQDVAEKAGAVYDTTIAQVLADFDRGISALSVPA